MPHDRFYVDDALEMGTCVLLLEEEAHHMAQVMRVRVGERVSLVNGRGSLADAEAIQISRQRCELRVLRVIVAKPDPFRIILAQGMPRFNRLDTIVEKGTELGMHEIWLFPADRSEKKALNESQEQRLQAIVVASMKQCGRLDLPKIVLKPPLHKWTELPFPAFYGALDAQAPSFSARLGELQPLQGSLFFVGPEAGFSNTEIADCKRLGAHGVSLHRNVLRTDTAPLVALTMLSQFYIPKQT